MPVSRISRSTRYVPLVTAASTKSTRWSTSSVLEQGQQQLVLAPEVAVEGLVGEPRLLDDLAHPGVDAGRAAHDLEPGLQQSPDFFGVGLVPGPERPQGHGLGSGNDVLHNRN